MNMTSISARLVTERIPVFGVTAYNNKFTMKVYTDPRVINYRTIKQWIGTPLLWKHIIRRKEILVGTQREDVMSSDDDE